MPRDHTLSDLKVLYVDDEEQSLKYLKMALSKVVDVLTAKDAEEALKVLDEHENEIGVLLTDQRMPGKTGVELLGDVRYRFPGIVRVLTTAYAELDDAIDAVNSGAIFAYVTKPWNVKKLQATIVQALELRSVQRERDLLVQEKLSVLHRQLVVDRLRSASLLAAALGGQLRHTDAAAYDFMMHSRAWPHGNGLRNGEDVWEAMRQETQQSARVARHVGRSVSSREPAESAVDTARLWQRAAESANVALRIEAAGVPRVASDGAVLQQALEHVVYVLSLTGESDRELTARGSQVTDIWGVPGVKWELSSSAEPTSVDAPKGRPRQTSTKASQAMMSAYFLLYHLAGRVFSAGLDGWSLALPLDPRSARVIEPEEDWVELLFEQSEELVPAGEGAP